MIIINLILEKIVKIINVVVRIFFFIFVCFLRRPWSATDSEEEEKHHIGICGDLVPVGMEKKKRRAFAANHVCRFIIHGFCGNPRFSARPMYATNLSLCSHANPLNSYSDDYCVILASVVGQGSYSC